jgi:hypothetical protein
VSPLKGVLDVLVLLDEIEWARPTGGVENPPPAPPTLVWRFKRPDAGLEARIEAAVKGYRGATGWTIYKGTRNWVIAPAAFDAFERQQLEHYRTDVAAAHAYGRLFPSETHEAAHDALGLAAHVRRRLLPQ